MLFNSIAFGLFLPFAVALFWYQHRRLRVWWLLGVSFIFYMQFIPKYVLLLFLVILINYLAGRCMGRWKSNGRLILRISLVANLAVLGVFKYIEFLMTSCQDILRMFGAEADFDGLKILLPIGISFYIFHGISYTVDCYRGRVPPVREFSLFATYIAFFPKLIAGPIVRADELIPQLRDLPAFRLSTFESGIRLLLQGLFKKILLADGLAPLVGAGFSNPASLAGVDAWTAVLAFTFQIYFDFSGYTDIARGCGRMFCLELPENFRLPYLAASPRDFWRRWHITLSTWLRDYLYIPLGGNRGGRSRTYRNLLITMGLAGLWHGAAWTFVLWGLFHGVLLAGNHVIRSLRPAKSEPAGAIGLYARRIPGTVTTFLLVVLGWVLFRAPNMDVAWAVYRGLFQYAPAGDLFRTFLSGNLPLLAALLVLYHGVRVGLRYFPDRTVLWLLRAGTYGGVLILICVTVFLSQYSPSHALNQPVPFLYFRF
jgi:alginate O-acetyltransferase complex protein AlgI